VAGLGVQQREAHQHVDSFALFAGEVAIRGKRLGSGDRRHRRGVDPQDLAHGFEYETGDAPVRAERRVMEIRTEVRGIRRPERRVLRELVRELVDLHDRVSLLRRDRPDVLVVGGDPAPNPLELLGRPRLAALEAVVSIRKEKRGRLRAGRQHVPFVVAGPGRHLLEKRKCRDIGKRDDEKVARRRSRPKQRSKTGGDDSIVLREIVGLGRAGGPDHAEGREGVIAAEEEHGPVRIAGRALGRLDRGETLGEKERAENPAGGRPARLR
jgi:hypothetical protein